VGLSRRGARFCERRAAGRREQRASLRAPDPSKTPSPRSKTLTSLAFCRQLRAFIGYEAIRSSPVRGLAFETGWAAKAKWLPSAPCTADEKSPWDSPCFLRARCTWSRDDEKPFSDCNGVTSGCDAVSVIDELIARYAGLTIRVIGLIRWVQSSGALVLRATCSRASAIACRTLST
jgi:hypothetical protein